jgi:hypothetical protein
MVNTYTLFCRTKVCRKCQGGEFKFNERGNSEAKVLQEIQKSIKKEDLVCNHLGIARIFWKVIIYGNNKGTQKETVNRSQGGRNSLNHAV